MGIRKSLWVNEQAQKSKITIGGGKWWDQQKGGRVREGIGGGGIERKGDVRRQRIVRRESNRGKRGKKGIRVGGG